MAVHSREVNTTVAVGDLIANEIPTGVIDGINTVFTISHDPVLGTVQVDLNGIRQSPGSGKDYNVSGKIITFSKAPRIGSEILAHYLKT